MKSILPVFTQKNISIIFVSDKMHIKHLSISMISTAQNISEQTNCDIILFGENLSPKSKQKLYFYLSSFFNHIFLSRVKLFDKKCFFKLNV